MHVHDCYIHNIATNGVYPKGGARNAIIERNLIMNCGTGASTWASAQTACG